MTTPVWPGIAGLPALPSRASWQRKSIQLPFASDNGETDAPEILWGTGAPEGVVLGTIGDYYLQTDVGVLWRKTTATLTTGWRTDTVPGVVNALAYAADTATGMCTAIRAVLAAFPAGGITIDARGFLAAQSFDADLLINVPEVTVLFPQAAVAMGAFSLRVAAGVHGVRFVWPKGWNGYVIGTGSFFKPRWTYSGSGIALRVGTSAADTKGLVVENFGVDLEGASAGAIGCSLERVQNYELIRPLVHDYQGASADTKIGIQLIGTGSFTGWGTIYQPILNRLLTSLKLLTANANVIIGGEIRGAVAAGSNGVDLDASEDNTFFGTDFDSLVIAMRFRATANNNRAFIRTEQNNTTDVQFDANAKANRIDCQRQLIVVDNGESNAQRFSVEFHSPAALANGNNNDFVTSARLSNNATIRVTPNGGSVMTGFAGGVPGRRLRVMVIGAGTCTLSHQDANSAAANRILHPAAASVALALDDVADLEYDGVTQRWRVCSVLQ